VEKNVWFQYSPGEINEKIRYWADRWQELVDNFNVNSYGLRLSSPHLLIRAISEEIEYNSLRNAETRALFKDELSRVLKQDPVVKTAHVVEFVALIKNFETAPLLYLDTLCAGVLPFFASGDYFRGSLKHLVSILKTDVWAPEDAQEIGHLSNVLIVEFLLNGYHVETIRTFPPALFNQISILPNGHPVTEFPHNVDWGSFQHEQSFDTGGYAAAISSEMEGLTIEDRLNALGCFFDRPLEQGSFIFPVSGLQNASRSTFRSVTLYSPIKDSLAVRHDMATANPEMFGRDAGLSPVNVAVDLAFRDSAAASEQAAEIAEELFDWMQPHWSPTNPVEIDRLNYIVVDSQKRIIREKSGLSHHNLFSISHHALDVDAFFQHLPTGLADSVVKRLMEIRADRPLANKLPVCLHWYRKAVEAGRGEDQLLYYWVVLERAFAFSRRDQDKKWSLTGTADTGRFRVIVEYVPVHEALTFMYDFAWQLYHYIYRLLGNRYMSVVTGQVVPYFSLSPKLMKACAFDGSSRTVTIDDFLPNLDRIAAEVADRVVKEKVEEVAKFYRDPLVAKASISKKFSTTRDEIVLIYRLRNSIVHQGHFNRKLLQPFAARAGELARNVIRILLTKFVDDPDASVETIFAGAKVQYDRTIARLEQNLRVDFVTPKQWGVYPRKSPGKEEPVSPTASTAG